jgi:aminopeptidase C
LRANVVEEHRELDEVYAVCHAREHHKPPPRQEVVEESWGKKPCGKEDVEVRSERGTKKSNLYQIIIKKKSSSANHQRSYRLQVGSNEHYSIRR